ncbi:hypothetical protein OBBRIDRAFT_250428 [Obba rivulosa]|uniref:MYND-type domain-containing protein n=1 Tax=Obba rivulosa TaxID=1052685 RepID=A0A8E2AKK8_9APHY|nr:hypothetical protein OBBRIDRAFT_250428 [Obba rivulosa]
MSSGNTPATSPPKSHFCRSCDEPATFRCSACSTSDAWYCGKACQKLDWTRHIFDCKPKDEIDTAYYLARSVYGDRIPEHPRTRQDYGFERAFTVESGSNLLGLYQGLMHIHEVSPQDLRKWRRKGSLIEEIKAAFSTSPPDNRGKYYPWFLNNLWVLDKSLPIPAEMENDFLTPGFQYCGIDPSLPPDRRASIMSSWPRRKQECSTFCIPMASRLYPGPESDLWISFGFCVCSNSYTEMQLGNLYYALLKQCTFDEMYHAYDTSRLIALMDSKGLEGARVEFTHLEGVLSGSPREWKTVWELKKFVMGDNTGIPTSVQVDYGFANCAEDAECQELMVVYRKLFTHELGDPMDLHQACIGGKIFEYVKDRMKLKKKFKVLMKNPYPLPDL